MITIQRKPLKLERRVVRGDYHYPQTIGSFKASVKINPEEYALIHEGDSNNLTVNSAISMNQSYFGNQGKNHKNTIYKVLGKGLTVPRTRRFLTHLDNVNKALAGKGILYDARGELLEGDKLLRYAMVLNHNCLVWLNDFFEPIGDREEGDLDLMLATYTRSRDGQVEVLKEPLLDCLHEDCYAEISSRNKQGFPTVRATVQKYNPGETVFYTFPRPKNAVGFVAGFVDAYLSCNADPLDSGPKFGVFECVEGTSAKK